jgi:hypothetical protein
MVKNKYNMIRSIVSFMLVRIFGGLALIAAGIGLMSLADSTSHLIFIGISYIVTLLAFIIVVSSDIFYRPPLFSKT